MINLQKFSTLIELLKYFSGEKVCIEYLELLRWSDGMKCAYKDCGHDKIFRFSNGKTYKCAKCEKQFSIRVGTIFEDSKVPLSKWYAAIYLITSHKKGISSIQLGKDIGVTQKTAWYMNHRVRHSLGWDVEDKLSGIVEADETFIGGKEGNKHKDKRTEGTQGRSVQTKTPVAGVVQRGGNVIAKKVKDTQGSTLRKFVNDNVQRGSQLHTDEWWGYKGLEKLFGHQVIKHNEKEYVNGDCHTNTLEGFWSLLKRGVVGIYHSMSNKHLQKYVDEFVFRYNTRQLTESDRFNLMLSGLATHLPYKKLIENEQSKPVQWLNTLPIGRAGGYSQISLSF
jgi:transposase-like protein